VTDDLVKRPDDEQDDLTLVYMWAYKMAEKKYKSRIEQLEAALRLGVDMRHAQVTYFKDRSKENLIASKQAEAAFDRAALGEKKDG
jgi:hypothetical protein